MTSEPAAMTAATGMPEAPGYVWRFQDLAVYRKSRALAKAVFAASKSFPRDEAYSLTDQVRRASRSIGAQLAEAWARRRYPRHFASKLTDADGEQLETQHWLVVAFDAGYLPEAETRRLGGLCLEVGRMLGEMIAKADQFCRPPQPGLREEPAPYPADADRFTVGLLSPDTLTDRGPTSSPTCH